MAITNVGPLVALQLTDISTYTLNDHNITFASHGSIGITITFTYSFPNDTTLVLSRPQTQLTLTKVK